MLCEYMCVGDAVCCVSVFVCGGGWVILCVVSVYCVLFVCDTVYLHSRKLVYSGEVSEPVKVPTVLSKF